MLNDPQLLNKIIIFSLNSVSFIIKFIIGLISVYLILQRFHLRLQMRFLKNISDEILKINDFCIEFSSKFDQYIENKSDLKTFNEIISLRHKIHNHLDYLTSILNSFPYGNPINFFWFSFFGSYFNKKIQVKADNLLTIYQSHISDDTVLQKDIDLKLLLNHRINILNNAHKSIENIDKRRIDEIILSGLDLIELLEDHSKRLF